MFISARDGTQLYVRHVQPSDKEIIGKAWLQLSEESQRRRFLAPKPVLTQRDLRYLTEVDGHDHVALIAVRLDEPDRMGGRGALRAADGRSGTAEVAVTVADYMQGRGVGKQLGGCWRTRRAGAGSSASRVDPDRQPPCAAPDAAMSDRLESSTDAA